MKDQVVFFVWVVTFVLSEMGHPTSGYAAASVALSITGLLKLHHDVKLGVTLWRSGTFMNIKL